MTEHERVGFFKDRLTRNHNYFSQLSLMFSLLLQELNFTFYFIYNMTIRLPLQNDLMLSSVLNNLNNLLVTNLMTIFQLEVRVWKKLYPIYII